MNRGMYILNNAIKYITREDQCLERPDWVCTLITSTPHQNSIYENWATINRALVPSNNNDNMQNIWVVYSGETERPGWLRYVSKTQKANNQIAHASFLVCWYICMLITCIFKNHWFWMFYMKLVKHKAWGSIEEPIHKIQVISLCELGRVYTWLRWSKPHFKYHREEVYSIIKYIHVGNWKG